MSLKTFLKNVWKKLVPKVKEEAEFGILILDKIKAGASYPELIEGLPPELIVKVQVFLRETVVKAGHVKDYIEGMDEDSILESIRSTLATATDNGDIYRNTFLNSLGILITDVFADGKLGWEDLVFLPKFIFSFIKKDK